MKTCTRCSNVLTADASYCYVCNSPQTGGFEDFELKPQYSDTFLKVLCILTLIGSGITLLAFFGLAVSYQFDRFEMEHSVVLIIIEIIVAVGKLIGAIFMLMKKLNGLYIYTVVAVLSIISSVYSAIEATSPLDTGFTIFVTALGPFFIIAFLIMYWLPVNRRVLS